MRACEPRGCRSVTFSHLAICSPLVTKGWPQQLVKEVGPSVQAVRKKLAAGYDALSSNIASINVVDWIGTTITYRSTVSKRFGPQSAMQKDIGRSVG